MTSERQSESREVGAMRTYAVIGLAVLALIAAGCDSRETALERQRDLEKRLEAEGKTMTQGEGAYFTLEQGGDPGPLITLEQTEAEEEKARAEAPMDNERPIKLVPEPAE